MQAVFTILTIAEAVRLEQRPVPGMPGVAVGEFDVQIDSDLADVVQ